MGTSTAEAVSKLPSALSMSSTEGMTEEDGTTSSETQNVGMEALIVGHQGVEKAMPVAPLQVPLLKTL
jgi:hypothetical protein